MTSARPAMRQSIASSDEARGRSTPRRGAGSRRRPGAARGRGRRGRSSARCSRPSRARGGLPDGGPPRTGEHGRATGHATTSGGRDGRALSRGMAREAFMPRPIPRPGRGARRAACRGGRGSGRRSGARTRGTTGRSPRGDPSSIDRGPGCRRTSRARGGADADRAWRLPGSRAGGRRAARQGRDTIARSGAGDPAVLALGRGRIGIAGAIPAHPATAAGWGRAEARALDAGVRMP